MPRPARCVPRGSAATQRDTELLEETEVVERLAPLWKVVCHDDPVTTMEFVVEVFVQIFRLPSARAFTVMMQVHYTGAAVVGRWPETAAKRKAERAKARARANGFPLTFTVEEDD